MRDNLRAHRVLSYDDVAIIPAGKSSEKLIEVRTYSPSIVAQYHKPDMHKYTGDLIYVRDTLAQKLAQANAALAADGLRLKIVYGYRHPDVQKAYFEKRKLELAGLFPLLSDRELERRTHAFVAVPSIGGHPAGAAVDLTIVDKANNELDMGTAIADFTDPHKIMTFTDGLDRTQAAHRQQLHDVMVAQGFAPFYGEWWHFSYGDREWAAFYHQGTALYGAVTTFPGTLSAG
jgi:D-alanyl-D-alanine dipeptidase